MNWVRMENDGAEISGSNFWETAPAAAGFYYLTPNAGTLRLLVPESRAKEIPEMLTGREVLVTRGPHRQHDNRPMIEIMFDDRSQNPFALYLSEEQIERGFSDAGDPPRRFLIYRAGPALAGELIWYYREAVLPCLKPLDPNP